MIGNQRRPQIVNGEMTNEEIFATIPENIRMNAKKAGDNIVVKMVPVIEFSPDGEVVETYTVPSGIRRVKPRAIARSVPSVLVRSEIVGIHKVDDEDDVRIVLEVVKMENGRWVESTIEIEPTREGLDWFVTKVRSQ